MPHRSSNAETKRRKQRAKAKKKHDQNAEMRPAISRPLTAAGNFKFGIFTAVTIGRKIKEMLEAAPKYEHIDEAGRTITTTDTRDIYPLQVASDIASIHYGCTDSHIRGVAAEVSQLIVTKGSIDSVSSVPIGCPKSIYVDIALGKYMDLKTMIFKKAPTRQELFSEVRAIASKHNDTICDRTIDRCLAQREWKLKLSDTFGQIASQRHNQNRLTYAKQVIEGNSPDVLDRVEYLYMDEMSIDIIKTPIKRFGGGRGVDSSLTIPSLNVVTYMTRDSLIYMGFSWDTTNAKRFEEHCLRALSAANERLPSKKDICLIYDDAAYHKLDAIQRCIDQIDVINMDARNPKRTITSQPISPFTPDLNLAEYFNLYYKALLRRAMNVFSHFIMTRPPQSLGGKPIEAQSVKRREEAAERQKKGEENEKAALKKKGIKQQSEKDQDVLVEESDDEPPEGYIRYTSKKNLMNLASYVYNKIKENQFPTGNWQIAHDHILLWAQALVKSQGDYALAAGSITTLYKSMVNTDEDTDPIWNAAAERMTCVRLMDPELLSIISPPFLDFTKEECDAVALERSYGYLDNDDDSDQQVEINNDFMKGIEKDQEEDEEGEEDDEEISLSQHTSPIHHSKVLSKNKTSEKKSTVSNHIRSITRMGDDDDSDSEPLDDNESNFSPKAKIHPNSSKSAHLFSHKNNNSRATTIDPSSDGDYNSASQSSHSEDDDYDGMKPLKKHHFKMSSQNTISTTHSSPSSKSIRRSTRSSEPTGPTIRKRLNQLEPNDMKRAKR